MQQYETRLEELRLVVYDHSTHCEVFVYDQGNCEVIYAGQRIKVDMAKYAAVDFALGNRFGANHVLDTQLIMKRLSWERR